MEKQKLILEQTDRKIHLLKTADALVIPSSGWIFTIRKALGMSMRQLGNRMGITPQSVKEIEDREKNKTVSLKVLNQFAKALDMKLIYGFVPKKGNLEDLIEKRALEMAKEIVGRTSISMKLEDQENSPKRIKNAIKEKADELKHELPKYLWD
ncbi:MAG: mobile mystery protein A [Bacteroidia bacterium]|nr:mobile mystery protein A [Bacteroidia bacterium]